MRWIQDDQEFAALLSRAHQFISEGQRAISQGSVLVFDDVVLSTPSFFSLLHLLMKCSSDKAVSYVVIDPDPVGYFYKFFGKYSAFEISDGDTAEEYLGMLNEDPGGSPADAVGLNVGGAVIFPESNSWFARVGRSPDDDGGKLAVPSAWVRQLTLAYPYLRSQKAESIG